MSETIQTKRCSKCKQIKPISEFYKHPKSKDGHQSHCKICDSKYQKSEKGKAAHKCYDQSDKGKANKKCYYQSERGKAVKRRNQQKIGLVHPEQIKAQNAVNNAIQAGKLPRPDSLKCYYCPKQAEQYHHHKGYAPEHWLDVVPVCNKCHNNLPCS